MINILPYLLLIHLIVQTSLYSSQEYIRKNYNIHDGLVQSTVRSVYQDSAGFMWIGTENGLSRFDGKEFVNYQKPDELFNSGIITIGQNEEGNIILLNFDGTMWKFDGECFSKILLSCITDEIEIIDFMFTRGGLLVATRQNGVYLCKEDTTVHFTSKEGLYHNRIRDITRDDYNIYIVSDGGVNALNYGKIYPLFRNDKIIHTACFKDSKGVYWTAGQNNGVYRRKNDKWQRVWEFSGLYVNGFAEDSDECLWVSSNIGLSRIVVNFYDETYVFNELNTLYVRSLVVDKEGNIWCGSYGRGLYHVSRNLFFNFTIENGFPSYFGKIIGIDSKDRIWVHASHAGIMIYSDTGTKRLSECTGHRVYNLSGFTETSDGKIILVADNQLYEYRDEKLIRIYDDGNKRRLHQCLADNTGRLWVTTLGGGLWYIKNGEWIHSDKVAENEYIRQIYEDNFGNIWIATFRNGLVKFKNDYKIILTEADGLLDNRPVSVHEYIDGSMWVASRKGIAVIEDSTVIDTIDINDGLPGNIVYSLGAYENLMLLGTGDGLVVYDDGDIRFFTTRNGLPSNDISDGHILVTKHGKAWFGTTAGVSVFQIYRYIHRDYFSQSYFTKIIIDDDTLSYSIPQNDYGNIGLSSANDFIHFDLNSISYTKDISDYRYRLSSEDSEGEWKYTKNNRLTLDELYSGSYEFLVETKSFGEDWKRAYSMPVLISDPIYKTAFFWLFILLGFSGTGAAYYYNEQKKKEKNKYKTSSLNNGRVNEVRVKIVDYVEQDKKYMNPGLTLQQLSDDIDIPKEHISQVINSEFKQSYSDYVNGLRIREAQAMLRKNGELNMQIIQIAYEVGFNSKSSFNIAFKKFTGQTPSEYKKIFAHAH